MPKRVVGPFPDLEGLNVPVDMPATEDAWLERMDALHVALLAQGCKCNGAFRNAVRDSDWGADISELVIRAWPHEVKDQDGVVEIVAVKLDTIRVEVDSYDEVMAWIYEESAP